jgi:hypothetical protein
MERKPEAVPLKKTYQVPKLQIYGDLVKMTKAFATSTKSDHGTNHMS